MATKKQRFNLRLSGNLRLDLDKLYRAKILLREEEGEKGSYSLNRFYEDIFIEFVHTSWSSKLQGIYEERLMEGDQEKNRANLKALLDKSKGEGHLW